MVTPDAISKVNEILEGNSIPYSVQMENVETYIFMFFLFHFETNYGANFVLHV